MSKTINLLAMDLGASNGRGILGKFDGQKLRVQEMHRFENNLHQLNGVLYWDILNLYSHVKQSITKTVDSCGAIDGIGIDSWALDYGLLDKNGQLLGNVISYRNSTNEDMEAVWEQISGKALFERTGIANLHFNTIFQLFAKKRHGDPALEHADALLMLPDLLAYFLTGEQKTEYTNGTTTMMIDPQTKNWDWELIRMLGLPEKIFTDIQPGSSLRGNILDQVGLETGCGRAPFYAVGTHDTASAIAAIPAEEKDFAFISSGTWSLLGTEVEDVVVNEEAYKANFSNEGSLQGGYRLLRNIMGLAIIQQCRREWQKSDPDLSWDSIVEAAERAKPFKALIDPDYPDFFILENMQEKISTFCRNTGQSVPEGIGEIARCVFESLALKYRWGVESLERIIGRNLNSLYIVGGGSKNQLLNQFTANALGKRVVAGPVESATVGNLLSQAIAMGELKDVGELRQVVRNSIDLKTFQPQDSSTWDEVYGKFIEIVA